MTDRIIETTAGQASAELQRRGLKPLDPVTIMLQPEQDSFLRARTDSRALVAAAGLTDNDIDALIEEARQDVAADLR